VAVFEELIGRLDGFEADWSDVGPTAALVVALAAGITGEAARRSAESWDEGAGAMAQATALRRRALRLAREDLAAHLAASDALDAARETRPEGAAGDGLLASALALAADLPLAIAEVAADAAQLAAAVAEAGEPDVRADAAGAALLAAGAACAASHLIEVNLATAPDDERLVRATELRAAADAASERGRLASA
jgi:methenyltetrahydrofolate cyclohydrolase